MAGIDKAGIVFSIVIVAVGAGFAFYMDAVEDTSSVVSTLIVSQTVEPKTQSDPFAGLAEKVKSESTMIEESIMERDIMERDTGPKKHRIDIPVGTSLPGCEGTNSCYLPAHITISVEDTVEWINVDTAVHTVTSGNVVEGPSFVFDSSLIMARESFTLTFEDAGIYDYYCMVHPWMIGSITAN